MFESEEASDTFDVGALEDKGDALFPYSRNAESEGLVSELKHNENLMTTSRSRKLERIRKETMFNVKVHNIIGMHREQCLLLFAKATQRYTDFRIGSYRIAWLKWWTLVKSERKVEKRREQFIKRQISMSHLKDTGTKRNRAQVKDMIIWMQNEKIFPKQIPLKMLDDICTHMSNRLLRKGETVFLQGDIGENYYIIIDGAIDLYLQEDPEAELRLRINRDKERRKFDKIDWTKRGIELGRKMKRMPIGVSFGELSLLNDEYSHRSCTAIGALENTQLCVIDRALYNRTLLKFHQNAAYMQTLKGKISELEAFKAWDPEYRMQILDHSTLHTFSCGSCLYNKYDKVNYIYFVLDGEVALVTDGKPRKKKKKGRKNKNMFKNDGDGALDGGLEDAVFDEETHPHHIFHTDKNIEICRQSNGSLLGDVEALHHINEHCTTGVVRSRECVFLMIPIEIFMRLVKLNKNTYHEALDNAKIKRMFEAKRFNVEVSKHKTFEENQKAEEAKRDAVQMKGKTIGQLGIVDKIRLDRQFEKERWKGEWKRGARGRKLPKIVTDHVSRGGTGTLEDGFVLNKGVEGGSGSASISFLTPQKLSAVTSSLCLSGPPIPAPKSDPTYNSKREAMEKTRQQDVERAFPWKMTRGSMLNTPSTATSKGVYSSLMSINKNKMNLYKSLSSTISEEQKMVDLKELARRNQVGKKWIVGEGIMRPMTGLSKVQPIGPR